MPSSSGNGLSPANSSADPRRRAATALARVDAEGAHAARLLGEATPFERELVLGALRWQRCLDHLLAARSRTPLDALDPSVRACLRAGAYEAQRMDTPAPVAVAEAVRVTRLLAPRATGLVNAVLRRVAAAPWPGDDPAATPGLRFSHPDWLVARWTTRLGDGLLAALAADQQPAPLHLLRSAGDPAALAAAGVVLEPHPWSAEIAVVRAGAQAAVRALRSGDAYAMDASAALIATLLPEVDGPIADLAAAPGGKSLVLAGGPHYAVHLAADRHLGRVAMMRRTFARLDRPPTCFAADAGASPLAPGSCAAVVLDAPCSGTGTLRRHPEIRWRLHPDDILQLQAVQRRLAAAAAALVAPGGFLLYSTCSIETEENDDVIASLPLEPVPLTERLPGGVLHLALTSGGVLIPPTADGDGFTVHLLRRA